MMTLSIGVNLATRTNRWRWILPLGAFVVGGIGLMAWWRDLSQPTDTATRALVQAGYTDFGMATARASRCAEKESTIAYWAQNRTTGAKVQGYICTRRSGEATFRHEPLAPGETLTLPGG